MLKRALRQLVLFLILEGVAIGLIVLVSALLRGREVAPWLANVSLVLGLALLVAPFAVVFLLDVRRPRWAEQVQRTGTSAAAEVMANDLMQGVAGYEGEDVWVQLPVRVSPTGSAAFEARLHLRLSQAMHLKPGASVSVRYDPQRPSRVVLDSAWRGPFQPA